MNNYRSTTIIPFIIVALSLLKSGALAQQPAPSSSAIANLGHSKHGSAFDEGPRQQAKLVSGLGSVHFPITTSNPLAQRFFDQGINYLYSFEYFEAERSFRQAVMLDPDCAMAYWGLAESNEDRSKEFLKLAQARRSKVTDREQRYIDAKAIELADTKDEKKQKGDYVHALEQLTMLYPEDLEAKVKLAWAMPRESEKSSHRMGIDALLREVISKNPKHPAAHHYRIHLWDGPDAAYALDSCRAYPAIAPNIGHAQHMPGHIYAQLGMWDEAAYAMDAAARVERRYFYDKHQLPFDSWNYAHDMHYLTANLGYLGRIAEGEKLAQELIDVPRDILANNSADGDAAGQGRFAMMRMRLRGERWQEILSDTVTTGDSPEQKSWRLYTQAIAHVSLGDPQSATKELAEIEKLKATGDAMDCIVLELKGRLALASGKTDIGLETLKKAVNIEKDKFAYSDPSSYPRPLYEVLAQAYMTAGRWSDAETTLRAGLKHEAHNGFALCLLLETLSHQGKMAEVQNVDDELVSIWKHADSDLPALKRLRSALDLLHVSCKVSKSFSSPYRSPGSLTRLGPNTWRPFPAPQLELLDRDGKKEKLSKFRGRNLLVINYLGAACAKCMEQLNTVSGFQDAFKKLNTAIIGVSPDSTSLLQSFLKTNANYPITLYSDPQSVAAKKLKIYDEFEDIALHAVVLLDRDGNIWWSHCGNGPFKDFEFLKKEVARMNAWQDRQNIHSASDNHE